MGAEKVDRRMFRRAFCHAPEQVPDKRVVAGEDFRKSEIGACREGAGGVFHGVENFFAAVLAKPRSLVRLRRPL